jgi:hypothetical protein
VSEEKFSAFYSKTLKARSYINNWHVNHHHHVMNHDQLTWNPILHDDRTPFEGRMLDGIAIIDDSGAYSWIVAGTATGIAPVLNAKCD